MPKSRSSSSSSSSSSNDGGGGGGKRLQEFRQEALQTHNDCRRAHGVADLQESEALQQSAQAWAEQLLEWRRAASSPRALRAEYGESVCFRTGFGCDSIGGSEVTLRWYSDVEKYNFEDGSGSAGNFTQLVWAGTQRVGFGAAVGDKIAVAVAHYEPAGNMSGRYAENVGPLVTDQPPPLPGRGGELRSTQRDSYEVTEEGIDFVVERQRDLLQDEEGRMRERVSEMRRQKPPGGGEADTNSRRTVSTSSSDDDGGSFLDRSRRAVPGTTVTFSDKERKKFAKKVLQQHNKYRSRHGAKALKLNKELSAMADAFARKLAAESELQNSGATFHGDRVGENLARRWGDGPTDYKPEEVVDHWYNERQQYRFGEEPTDIEGIGNFTQLVWRKSKELGVGKAVHCGMDGSHTAVVVCYYYPSGNVMQCFRENVGQSSK